MNQSTIPCNSHGFDCLQKTLLKSTSNPLSQSILSVDIIKCSGYTVQVQNGLLVGISGLHVAIRVQLLLWEQFHVFQ